MTGEALNYFVCANSANGFINYFNENLASLDRLYILKGGPGTGKSTMMNRIGETFRLMGYDIERIHCSADNQSLDGVFIQTLNVGIVDGTSPHVIEPKAPGAIEEYVNLGLAWDNKRLVGQKSAILMLQQQISQCYQKTYRLLAKSKAYYQTIAGYYASFVQEEKRDQMIKEVLADVFFQQVDQKRQGKRIDRFASGLSPIGMIDYVDNLINCVGKCYYVKGLWGTGKTLLLNKAVDQALALGYDVQVYHWPYLADELDLVIIPQLDTCLLDASGKFADKAYRHKDCIIDFGDALIGFDAEQIDGSITEALVAWQTLINEATVALAEAKSNHDDLEKIYIPTVDYTVVEQLGDVIIENIKELMDDFVPVH